MIYLDYRNSYTTVSVPKKQSEEDKLGIKLILEACKIEINVFRKRGKRTRMVKEILDYFDKSMFPSGWIHKIMLILNRTQIPYKLNYKNTQWEIPENHDLRKNSENYYYQDEAVEAAMFYKRGIIRLPTGSGKTRVASELIGCLSIPTLFLVPTIPLMYQTHKVLTKKFGEDMVGLIGDHEFNPSVITVASNMTVYSRIEKQEILEILNNVGLLILDEAHKINWTTRKKIVTVKGIKKEISYSVLQNAYFEIVQKCGAEYKIALTATPGTSGSLGRCLLEACTGPVLYRKSASDLYKEGYISKPKVCMFTFNTDHLPLSSNWRESKATLVGDFKFKTLVTDICKLFISKKKTVLVSCDEVESQIKPYSELVPKSEILVGKRSAKEFSGGKKYREYLSEILQRFKDREIQVLFSTIMKEGIDVPSMDVVVLPFLGTKFNAVIQRAGRVLRKFEGKEVGYIIVFYFQDDGPLEKHSKNRIQHFVDEGYPVEILTTPSEIFGGVIKNELEKLKARKKQFFGLRG